MTIVFTDSFTVGADVALESYPSGTPDYVSILGGNNLDVIAANDNVQSSVTSADVMYRITNAAAPTGDQKLTITAGWQTGYTGGYIGVRGSASGNYYNLTRANSTTWELYRVDSTVFTLLTTHSVSTTDNSSGTISLKATGAGATVSITATIAGVDQTTFNDTAANRKTSGTPTIGGFQNSAVSSANFIDDVSVDDLATAAGNIPYQPNYHRAPVMAQ